MAPSPTFQLLYFLDINSPLIEVILIKNQKKSKNSNQIISQKENQQKIRNKKKSNRNQNLVLQVRSELALGLRGSSGKEYSLV